MTVEFCYLIFITLDFYVINYFIVSKFLSKNKYTLFAIITIATIFLSAWLRALVAQQMNSHFFHVPPVDFGVLYLNSVLNISIWVVLFTLLKMLIDRIQNRQQLERAEKEKIKNELDYLKAQINPHALFNSLNTIYGHIDKNNQSARKILLHFSELLKYQLYECTEDKVVLTKEIAYIKNYVDFQRLRKADNLIVSVDTDAISPGLKIAPLLIIVLIENAFKFVSSFSDKENKIAIRISTKENTIHCSVFNTKDSIDPTGNAITGGIGIVNLQRRLELLYARKHTLHIEDEKDFYRVTLTINLE